MIRAPSLHTWLPAATLALAFTLPGCGHDDPDPVVVVDPTLTPGTLVVRWTIDGVPDPNRCVQTFSSVIEVRIFDPGGNELAAFQSPCTNFATSITLDIGTYFGTALLVGTDGRPRTTEAPIAAFTFRGNDILEVGVEFPASSFF